MKKIGVDPPKKRERESLELNWYIIAIEWNN